MDDIIKFVDSIDWAAVNEAVMSIEGLGYGSTVLMIAGLIIGWRRWRKGS